MKVCCQGRRTKEKDWCVYPVESGRELRDLRCLERVWRVTLVEKLIVVSTPTEDQ